MNIYRVVILKGVKFFTFSIVCILILSSCWSSIRRKYYWKPVCEKATLPGRILDVNVETKKYAEIHSRRMSCLGSIGKEVSQPDEYSSAVSCSLNFSGPKGFKIEGGRISNEDGYANIRVYPRPLFGEIEDVVPKYFGLNTAAYKLWDDRVRWDRTLNVSIFHERSSEVKFVVYSQEYAVKQFLKIQFYTNVVFQVRDIDTNKDIAGYTLRIEPTDNENYLGQIRARLNEFFSEEYTDIILANPNQFDFLDAESFTADSPSKTLFLYTPFTYKIEFTHPDFNHYQGTINVYDSSRVIFEMSKLGSKLGVKIIY